MEKVKRDGKGMERELKGERESECVRGRELAERERERETETETEAGADCKA